MACAGDFLSKRPSLICADNGAVLRGNLSADEHVINALRREHRIVKRCAVLDFLRIKDHNVRVRTDIQSALLRKPQTLCRGACHLADGFIKRQIAVPDKLGNKLRE